MRALLFAIALLSIGHAQAAVTYFWPGKNGTQHSTAVSACKSHAGGNIRYDGTVVASNGTSALCQMTNTVQTWLEASLTIYRGGDSCPGTWNNQIGECVLPLGNAGESCEGPDAGLTKFGYVYNSQGQCVDYTRADTSSQCKMLAGTSGPATVAVIFNDDGSPQIPPPMNVGGCAGIVASVEHCEMAPVRCGGPSGNSCMQSSVNNCKVLVSFSGAVSGDGKPLVIKGHEGAEEGVCQPGDSCDPTPAPIQNEEKPCTYVEDGEGRRVCDSNKWTGVPGEKSCGTVNGQLTCIGKAPTSNGISIGTVVEEKANADGTKTVTKTDVHNETKCIGAGSCKTETTTNKTVIVKDAGGNIIGQSGSCVGPKCAKDGNGDKNGDGLDDCKAGDASCSEDGPITEPTRGDVPGFGEAAATFMGKIEGAPIIASVKAIKMNSGGSCSFGDSASTPIGSISASGVCAQTHWLDPLYVVFLAIHALAAVRVFLSA